MDCGVCLNSPAWTWFLPKGMFSICSECGTYGIKKTKSMQMAGRLSYILYLLLVVIISLIYNG